MTTFVVIIYDSFSGILGFSEQEFEYYLSRKHLTYL